MTASEWKAKGEAAAEVVELALPSGMVITARRPGPMQFAAWDRLPMLLDVMDGVTRGEDVSNEEGVAVAGFLRELLIYCCVAPRVSMTPAGDEVHPRELPSADWAFIVRWGMRLEEAEAVRPFRGQRANDSGGRDGENVFVQTVGADGDRGSGAGTGVRPGGVPAGDRVGER